MPSVFVSRFVAPLVSLVIPIGFALAASGIAKAGDLKGRVAGFEALRPIAYASASADRHGFTVRELDPLVPSKFAEIGADPDHDVTLAIFATNGGAGDKGAYMPAFTVRIAGGRATPSTAVIPSGVPVLFRNDDPCVHHLVGEGWSRDLKPGESHRVEPKGKGLSMVTDSLTPTVRAWIVVDDKVIATRMPSHDGTFKLDLPAGEYVVKVFFEGVEKASAPSTKVAATGAVELKDPLVVAAVPSASASTK